MGGVSLITVEALFLVVTAWLAVFAQSWFGGIRVLTGAQVDVLPSLMVYAGLTGGMWSVGLLSFFAGTLLDSLSLNPLGVSVFPLFVVGWAVNTKSGTDSEDGAVCPVFTGDWSGGIGAVADPFDHCVFDGGTGGTSCGRVGVFMAVDRDGFGGRGSDACDLPVWGFVASDVPV